MSTVELRKVEKRYGSVAAVHSLDLAIEPGEFVTLLGPSGCGKSTTLRMVAGFVQPNAGTIEIGGKDVTGIPPHRREVGLVFQNYALFPHMSVYKNVEFGLKMRGVDPSERRSRVEEALGLVKLGDYSERMPAQLSGGQQQRVALARALVIRPNVLLLDEPFGALDKQLRDHMRIELRDLQRKLNISTMFVTHDQDEALSMSDRIVVMSEGTVCQVGGPNAIYEKPNSRFVADFMGRSNLFEARQVDESNDARTLDAEGLLLNADKTQELNGGNAIVMVRPEKIELLESETNRDGSVTVGGKIMSSVYLGSTVQYEVKVEDGPTVLVVRQNVEDGSISAQPGSPVFLSIPHNAVYIIPQ
ncbi:MAG: ABC transporter ATP-binding protein [Alphaproteobacteria bacterium]|nr:ABC transporter ATP-binding protein [Alphaproteobacteria bacterium]